MKRNPLKEQPIPAGLGKILLAHLIPDAKNPRKDLKKGDPEFEKINKSVEKFGQLDPIIFNTRTRKILGGHQRIKVLDSQGYTELFTVTLGAYTWAFAEADLKELSEKEENAANIALNKAQGDWDIDQLTINLQELKLDDMLEFTGFDDIEFDGMLRDLHKDDEPLDAEPQISRAEELRKEWGTELGQMWKCGEHRVICGDCTDPAVVAKLMQGERASICFTSPPYNLGDNVKLSTRGRKKSAYEDDGDNKTSDNYLKFLSAFFDCIHPICDYSLVNIQMLAGNKIAVIEFLNKYRGYLADVAVWYKTNPAPAVAENVMNSAFEFIFFFSCKENPPRSINSGNFRGSFSNAYKGTVNHENIAPDIHSAAMPLTMATDFIRTFAGDVVLEPFLGTGTTMIACENLGRKCRGAEIDPGYVAVILQRYKDTFPGKEIKQIS
jgi:DNA modification methylase